jgi:hypothetical protein
MPRKRKTTPAETASDQNPIYKIDDLVGVIHESTASQIELWQANAKAKERVDSNVPPKMTPFSDIDLNQWQKYGRVITDSLWLIGARGKSGMHNGDYHGNFIPQIPYQAMMRYTKKGDVVLDTFLGSGTTLIECRQLGRNGIGIELIPSIAAESLKRIEAETNQSGVWTDVLTGDSTNEQTFERVRKLLVQHEREQLQLIIMHPPYHDIIKFSDNPQDLCNSPTLERFLEGFGCVVRSSYGLLEDNRFLVVVIGDKYGKGEWVPLGFLTMQKVMQCGYRLKSIVVKNIVNTRAKRNLDNFWRRRALTGGFYIFKHEYVMFFQKPRRSRT